MMYHKKLDTSETMNIGGIMHNIAIGVPSGETVSSSFMVHICSMLMKNEFPISIFANAVSSRIAYNRNCIVDMAKKLNSTHLLFIDADMIFPADSLRILLAHDKDIIGATAAKRQDGADQAIGETFTGEVLKISDKPIKMKLIGPCLMLIKMSVFDKLKKPYFCEPPNWMMDKPTDDGIMPEDEYFCQAAIKAEIDIYCDTQLSMYIGHRGSKTYYIGQPAQQLPLTPLHPFTTNVKLA